MSRRIQVLRKIAKTGIVILQCKGQQVRLTGRLLHVGAEVSLAQLLEYTKKIA